MAEESPQLRATKPDYPAIGSALRAEFGVLIESETFTCPEANQNATQTDGLIFVARCISQARMTNGQINVEMIVRKVDGDWMVDLIWITWVPGGKLEPQDRPV